MCTAADVTRKTCPRRAVITVYDIPPGHARFPQSYPSDGVRCCFVQPPPCIAGYGSQWWANSGLAIGYSTYVVAAACGRRTEEEEEEEEEVDYPDIRPLCCASALVALS